MSDALVPAKGDSAIQIQTKSGPVVIARPSRQRKLLTEPILFEEYGVPAFVRGGLVVAALVLALFLVWAGLVQIDEVAVATGEVVPSSQVKVVQHLEGGVVAELLVEDGSIVEQGQVLLRMDPAPARAELEQQQARYFGLLLRAERLNAVVENREPNFEGITTAYPGLTADQYKLWLGQLDARRTAIDVVDSQTAQRTREITQLREALAIAEQQLSLTSAQVAIRKDAMESGVVSRQIYLETARSKVAAEGEVTRIKEQIKVASDALAEARNRASNLIATQEQDALGELGLLTHEIEQVRSTMSKLEDRVQRLEIVAPVAGVVQEMKVKAAREVVAPGLVLMRVVPVDDVLEAEIRISTRDIGHIKIGHPVKVRVSSYEYTRFGAIAGTLTRISPTTLLDDEAQTPYYRGVVQLDQPYVGKNPGQYPVMPGMSVEADIVTGEKLLISYLLKPVADTFNRGFQER